MRAAQYETHEQQQNKKNIKEILKSERKRDKAKGEGNTAHTRTRTHAHTQQQKKKTDKRGG